MKRRIVTALAVCLLLVAAGAAGAVVRDVVTPRGQSVGFAGDGGHWSCFNGRAISCMSGDAEPSATLSKSAILIRVVNLKPACMKRVLRPSPDPSDPNMRPYYEYIHTFKPFGSCR